MKRMLLIIPIVAVMAAGATGQAPKEPILVIDSVETRWDGVFADLVEFSKPSADEVMVRWRYRNVGQQPMRFPDLGTITNHTRVIDPAGRTIYLPLKDSDGDVVGSSTINTGSIKTGKTIAPGASQLHWVKVTPPPGDAGLSVVVPGALPFENVSIGAKATVKPLTAARPAQVTQEGETEGLSVEVVDARRVPGGMVNVVFRYRYGGAKRFGFDDLSNIVPRAYILDPQGRTKYEVMRDTSKDPISGTTIEFGSIPNGIRLNPGTTMHTWAKFHAPPDTVKKVTVVLPNAPPLEGVVITGSGGSTPDAGRAVIGESRGVEAALKELGARVTDTEIRIDLAADVLFDFDKAEIRKEAGPSLQKIAAVIAANQGAAVSIEGHADSKGSDSHNLPLSEKRAAAVKAWLIANAGISEA